MSKLYYNPIELPELSAEKKTADPTVDAWPIKEQFDLVNDRIAKELDRIQNGISDLTPYPRYFNEKEPIMHSFRLFKETPNKQNWVKFMILSEQDLGLRAANQFEKWFGLIFTGKVSYKEEQ